MIEFMQGGGKVEVFEDSSCSGKNFCQSVGMELDLYGNWQHDFIFEPRTAAIKNARTYL